MAGGFKGALRIVVVGLAGSLRDDGLDFDRDLDLRVRARARHPGET